MIMEYHQCNTEIVELFIQKCVICLENPSIYAFRLCGHQCICEHFHQNIADVDLLKCVICKTQLFALQSVGEAGMYLASLYSINS